MLGENGPAGLRLFGWARDDLCSPGLDHRASARFLLVRDPDHVDLALESDQPARERERTSPLARARLGRQPRTSFPLVVVRLRHGGVRLVAPRRADTLVLVEDARAGPNCLLEPARTEQWRRPPEAEDAENLFR